jgi:tellurite methyltransferase
MNRNQSVEFFDTQFQKQVANGDYALNPFEKAALPFLRGRVLDFGCGLGNLSIEAARSGLEVLAVDASSAAIERIRSAAPAERLRLEGIEADVEKYVIPGQFDTIVAIGLYMFFRRETALALLTRTQEHVTGGGLAIVNVLIEGTTFMGMFEPGNYYLFGREELRERFEGWDVLYHAYDSFDAPGNTKKEFATIVVQKRRSS